MNSGKEEYLANCKSYFIEHGLIERFLLDYSKHPFRGVDAPCRLGPINAGISYLPCNFNWATHSLRLRSLYKLDKCLPTSIPTVQEFIDYISIPQPLVAYEYW
jgi:hypothetical protein